MNGEEKKKKDDHGKLKEQRRYYKVNMHDKKTNIET